MKGYKTFPIVLDLELWQRIRMASVKKNITLKDFIMQAIEKALEG